MESAEDQSAPNIERKARIERLKRDLFGDLLTTAEVAEILEVHPRTVGEYIRDRKLHAIQLGGSWRVSEDSLKAFVTGLYLQGSAAEGGSESGSSDVRVVAGAGSRLSSRSGASMFGRFTDRARRVVVLAQEEARILMHHYIGTEHLLLGLLAEERGVAAVALREVGVSLQDARDAVEEMIGIGNSTPTGHIPFTPRAKKVLELTLREALSLGHNYIGTEHILLGLVREAEGVAALVIQKSTELKDVRETVMQLLRGATPESYSSPGAEKAKGQKTSSSEKSKSSKSKNSSDKNGDASLDAETARGKPKAPQRPKRASPKSKSKTAKPRKKPPTAKSKAKRVSSKESKPGSRKKKQT